MTMQTWYFSENPYPYLPEPYPSKYEAVRITLPSQYYDPKIGAELYNRYFDEWQLADELGLNVMANEHHSTATCLNASVAVCTAVLARITRKARILVLGNPIANRCDPVRVAEEMAMIDNYSRGRLEVGFVRGVPYEVIATNNSPMRMVERMWEAHDLIVKAWTTHDGPFSWHGRYFEHRQVNVWPRPYQTPHPPVWITSTSTSHMQRIADRGYVVATFLTGVEQTKRVFDAYRDRRHALELPMSEDRLAYAALVYVGETDEAGLAGAEKLLWFLRANRVPMQFKNPPGYSSVESAVKIMRGAPYSVDRDASLEAYIDRGVVFAGNPDTVYRQIRQHYNAVGGYGQLLMMGQAGLLTHAETVSNLNLFATEVYPRLQQLTLGDAGVAA
jgi:alkanesulfonate monooxygenase SsuD/methylene tetrahydromethanopterin reductase-like flavin-dependent oxidoreductase (luciferase family)